MYANSHKYISRINLSLWYNNITILNTYVFILSDILGECADIHTGGVDLKFPHHDNEIAQAEVHVASVCTVAYSHNKLSLSLSLSPLSLGLLRP